MPIEDQILGHESSGRVDKPPNLRTLNGLVVGVEVSLGGPRLEMAPFRRWPGVMIVTGMVNLKQIGTCFKNISLSSISKSEEWRVR